MQYIADKLAMEDDSLIEEAIEGVIEHQTGVIVDLTPRSPENVSQGMQGL